MIDCSTPEAEASGELTVYRLSFKRSGTVARLSYVLPVLLIAALSVSLQGTDGTENLIRLIESRYNGAKTLSVHFVEDFSYQGHRRPPEAGDLTLRKQGKMRWDYAQPAGKLFLSDGKTIYLYTAADNRVERMPVRDTEDMRAPLAFLLGHLDLKKEFRRFSEQRAADGVWLTAFAKNDRVPYESVDMLVREDGSIRQLKILGRDGASMLFAFDGERLNPPVPESLFHFAAPAGAEVVDAVGFAANGN